MNWHFEQKVDLQHPSGVVSYPDPLMAQGDHLAHTWHVQVYSGGRPMDLTGYAVTAYFDRSDGKMVPVMGSAVGHVASVELPQSVYVAAGPLTGLLRAGKDGQIITLAAGRWNVRRGPGDEIVDPGHVVPTVEELLARIGEMKVQTQAASTAANQANTAANAANDVVGRAETAAGAADTAADKANAAAARVHTAIQTANTAATNADAKATAASTAAGKANTAAANADTATGKANTAAANANTKATAAQTAADKANAKAAAANTAAGNANASAANADTAARAANEAAARVERAVESAGTAASAASAAADSANQAATSANTAAEGVDSKVESAVAPVVEDVTALKGGLSGLDDYVTAELLYDTYKDQNVTKVYKGTNGYYKASDGSFVADNFNATTKIAVQHNDQFIISGTYGYASCLIAEFDKNGDFIKPVLYKEDGQGATTVNDYEYVVQSNVCYIAISSISNTFVITKRTYKDTKEKISDVEKAVNGIKKNEVYFEAISDYTTTKEVLNQNGTTSANNSSSVTGYIAVSNDILLISTKAKYTTCCLATYDENKNFINKYGYTSDGTQTVWENKEIEIPPEVSYVRIGGFGSATVISVKRKIKPLSFRVTELEKSKGNVLFGKKWVACGDSYTKGDFTGYVDSQGKTLEESDAYDREYGMYKTYPWWIAKRNGMILVNEAIMGSTLAYPRSGNPEETSAFSFERYKNIPSDADYITLWFGINDASHCDLGNKGDGTVNTFYGALEVVLYYLITHHPKAKIGVIVTNRSTAEIRQATRDVCNSFAIPYLDMMGDRKVPIIFGKEESTGVSSNIVGVRNNQFVVSSSNSHPNLWAHEYESTFIENWLRSL